MFKIKFFIQLKSYIFDNNRGNNGLGAMKSPNEYIKLIQFRNNCLFLKVRKIRIKFQKKKLTDQ